MRILYCNPSENKTLSLAYTNTDEEGEVKTVEVPYPQAEDMLHVFTEVLPEPNAVDAIIFVNDAGTFTTVRTLAAICNALAHASKAQLFVIQSSIGEVTTERLEHTVKNTQAQAIIVPQYSGMPNISIAKT